MENHQHPARYIAAIICLGLLSTFFLPPAHDAQAAKNKKPNKNVPYVSIQELYAETRGGWQGSYTPADTRGFAPDGYIVNVDVPIEVPDVSKFPIVEIAIKKDVLKDETFIPMMEGQIREDGILECSTLPPWGSEDAIFFDEFVFPEATNGQAERNPLTSEQARKVGQQLLQKYFHEDNFRIRGIVAYETTPSVEKMPDSYKEFCKKLDVAPYIMVGEQVFEGVPLLFSYFHYQRYLAHSYFSLTLYSEDTWLLTGEALTQVGIQSDDVPLLPWSEILKVIEQQYMGTGKTLDVYGIHLGYELVLQKKGPSTPAGRTGDRKTYPKGTFEEIYYVRPVWVLSGLHTWPCAPGSNTIWEATAAERLRISDGRLVVIDAQTGKIVYTDEDTDFNNLAPTILTWDDVGGRK